MNNVLKSKMEARITLEKQNKSNDQVTELNLDNCQAAQISGLTDEFLNLESLSMINVGLTTLKGFPKLPKLRKLELSDNRITCGLNLLHGSPQLQHLNLSGNRIKDLEALEPLKEFKDLINLDLFNCEVTKSEDYRRKVFEMLPNLRSLDGYDQNEKEVKSDDEEDDEDSEEDEEIEDGSYGKHSEGKIVDDDDHDDDDDEDEDDDDEDEDEYEDDYESDDDDAEDFGDEDGDDDDDDDEEDDDDADSAGDEDDANTNAEVDLESSKQTNKGHKRKHEDEGGDEVNED